MDVHLPIQNVTKYNGENYQKRGGLSEITLLILPTASNQQEKISKSGIWEGGRRGGVRRGGLGRLRLEQVTRGGEEGGSGADLGLQEGRQGPFGAPGLSTVARFDTAAPRWQGRGAKGSP